MRLFIFGFGFWSTHHAKPPLGKPLSLRFSCNNQIRGRTRALDTPHVPGAPPLRAADLFLCSPSPSPFVGTRLGFDLLRSSCELKKGDACVSECVFWLTPLLLFRECGSEESLTSPPPRVCLFAD